LILWPAALISLPEPGIAQRRGTFFGSFFQKRTSFLIPANLPPMPSLDPAPLIHLAHESLAKGAIADALKHARRARARAPDRPETHHTYGLAALAAGRTSEAAAAFAKAADLAPTFADAWHHLGIARYRDGKIAAAMAATQQALVIDPQHPAANANLAIFQRLLGDAGVADERLAANAGAPESRLARAMMLLNEERGADALAILDIEPPPALRPLWTLQRALAFIQTKNLAAARALLDATPVPPDLAPLKFWRQILLAIAERDIQTAATHAEHMASALAAAGPAMDPEHRIMAQFDLAKFWSGLKQPDRAFPFWANGHALLRRTQPFSRPDYLAFVDASIDAFSAARLQSGPRASNQDPAPVFIVGMPRSGTTLAEQILTAHPAVHGAGERLALNRLFIELGGAWETPDAVRRVAALDTAALDAAAAPYLAELHALSTDATYIVDKLPANFRYCGLIALLFPKARIIHCTRDPRDIGLSIFSYRFFGYHAYAHDLADLGWYIRQHDRLMAHWQAVLPNPLITLPLRDWVEHFDDTLARVLTFLDLPYAEECARFHQSNTRVTTVSRAQVRQPINPRGLDRWQAYAKHLAPLIEELNKGSPH
jgi:hypothetical protein